MNKNVIIGISIFVLLAFFGGGYYFLSSGKVQQAELIEEEQVEEEVVPTISPDELGLTLSSRIDKKAVKFAIANAKDITSVEYEISYLAKGDIPRGAIGKVEPKPGEGSIETKYIELGSCSSGKCKYDEGVTSVKFTFKVTKADGKVYQTEKALDL